MSLITVPSSFLDFNTREFYMVHNNSDVKKLLGLNPFSELPYLSDDEFNTILQNAIDVIKTMELFK
jgi:predicted methyltransferase